ncbi:hypothetical protein D9758_009666 [Tetrapyrgos nigripes]|uniref:Protein artemis n=1 Tax=Tetrapyrgos nigripes TaxID=182062 RepID=A0A8H5CR84_9AGAR|nr:hypothetical protein D9758_009666 [Tetrapyrgos nigripes]
MPGLGTPFNSFILPYPIRVDAFTSVPNDAPYQPKLYLLTHTHSDHITGLQAKSFAQTVVCSADAKSMLLRHQAYGERALSSAGVRAEPQKTYAHLKKDPWVGPNKEICYEGTRDLLQPLRLNERTRFELDASEEGEVWITAFDANHCPGSVMYLVEGTEGAVLHTGDFRAEPWFLESLKHNPFLQPYLASNSPNESGYEFGNGVLKTLEAIYLDTACVMQTHQVPTKENATTGLISLLALYPPTTKFFINAWTWGYEDILKAIVRHFGCHIHLDSYKFDVFRRLKNDPFLSNLGTRDENATRFHSCERFERCSQVAPDDEEVVYVNPVSSMTPQMWEVYLEETKNKILVDPRKVKSLLVPLSRHSPLSELQAFVSLFRPKRVIPNALEPPLKEIDWAAIDKVFEQCLCTSTSSSKSKLPATPQPSKQLIKQVYRDEKEKRELRERKREEQRRAMQKLTGKQNPLRQEESENEDDEEEEDVAIKNIVTGSASVGDGNPSSGAGQGQRKGTKAREKEEKRFAKKWVVRTGEDVEVSGHRASASENGSKSKKGRMERRIGILVDWLGLRKKEGSSSPCRSGQFGNVQSEPGPGPRTAQVTTPTLQSGRMRQIAYDEDDIPLPCNWRSRCTEPSTPEANRRDVDERDYEWLSGGRTRRENQREGPSSSTTKTVTRSPVSPAGPLKPKPSTSTYTSHQQHPILIPSPNLPHKSAFSSKYPMPMRSSTPLLESQSSQLSNDYDSCDDDEERGRTAHFLFAQNRDEDFYGFEDDSGAIESPGHSAKSTPRRVRDGGGVSSTTSSHKISKGRTHAERTHPLDRRLTPNSSPVTRRHDLPLPSDLPPSFPPSMSASPRHRHDTTTSWQTR